MNKLVIARPAHEVILVGGPATLTYNVGDVLPLHPACDLWMQGAKTAELRRVVVEGSSVERLLVRPLVSGKPIKGRLRAILVEHVLI